MRDIEPNGGVRFGHTVIDAVVGELIDQPVQAIVYAANTRGVMGAGPITSIRSAGGAEIERAAMEVAPIEPGTAIVTASGQLSDRGIESIIHASIAPGLGDPSRLPIVLRALNAALEQATAHRLVSIAIPLIGLSAEAAVEERLAVAQSLVETAVSYVRRPGSRIESLIFVSRFEDDRLGFMNAIVRARERSW